MLATFPRLMLDHAARRPGAPALREKEYGIWLTLSWSALARLVHDLAGGFAGAAATTSTAFGVSATATTGVSCWATVSQLEAAFSALCMLPVL